MSGAEGLVEKLRRWTSSALASVTIAKAIPVIAEEYDFDDAETALRQIWAALDERHGELATALTTAEARIQELEAALERGWKYYYPDDGETVDDAEELNVPCFDADDAAQSACEDDYNNRDGWERPLGEEFVVAVVSPDGTESRFAAWNEVTVEHRARALT